MIDTDDDIVELLMIPRIGRKKARALFAAGYKTIEDIAKAKIEDLEKVPGIWDELATEMKDFAATIVEASDERQADKLETGASLFLCPECGSMVSTGADKCPSCGVEFSEEEDVGVEPEVKPVEKAGEDSGDGYWYSTEVPRLYLCPECGAMIASDSTECASCGAVFEGEEEAVEEPEPRKPDDVDGFWYQKDTSLYICPSCGAFIPEDAESCQTCGIVFEGEEETPPETKEFKCPNCRADIGEEVEDCPKCGFHFEREVEDGFWYKDQTTLFVCPNCGVFIPADADQCTQCGVVFEGVDEEEMEPERPVDGEPKDEFDQSLYLCQACGAFVSENATSCSVCGADVTEEEEERRAEEGAFELPEITQDMTDDIKAEIEEMEAEELVSPREVEGLLELEKLEKKPSIVKDFKKRWETIQLTEEEIEKELGLDLLTLPDTPEEGRLAEIDTALYSDAKNHELWEEKAEILIALERKDEAIACLDMAAELNPHKGTDYKRKILELLVVREEEEIDISELLDVDEEGEVKLDDDTIQDKIREQIGEIDAKLEENPEDEALWQEKGELLEQLGEHEEAIKCFDESIKLSYTSVQEDAEVQALSLSLPEIAFGLTNGQGRVNGQVNGLLMQRGLINGVGKVNGLVNGGLVNGKVNGLVNGRVNGRVNGLINGGLVNGKVNGLINGGLVNGKVNGLINGGMINGQGLVNGEGLINGRGRFYGSRRIDRERREWRYRVSWVVMLVALVLLVPMFANLLSPPGTHPIAIDGNFSDWTDINTFYDSPVDQVDNPDLNIIETKSVYNRDRMDVYIRVEGAALGGSPGPTYNASVDSVYIFADFDNDVDTGYLINGLGADLMTEVWGWSNNLRASTQYRFTGPGGQSDWNSFESYRQATCAVEGDEIEVRTWIPQDMIVTQDHNPAIIAVGVDSSGRTDATDFAFSNKPASLKVRTYASGPDVLSTGPNHEMLRLELRSFAGESTVTGINFTLAGDVQLGQVDNVHLWSDSNGDSAFDPSTDTELGRINTLPSTGFMIALGGGITIDADTAHTLFLAADLSASASGQTIGFVTSDVMAADSLVSVTNLERKLHNVGSPSAFNIDGAFGDWAGTTPNIDPANDVFSPEYNFTMINRNVDLADTRFGYDGSVFVYLSTSGVMMGGENIPTIKLRPRLPGPVPPADTDRDTVPDIDDPFPFDFDNNDVIDNLENNDLDNDGEVDYDRGGTDNWLNTTIPSTGFPLDYANASVSIYIGPIIHEENLGEDHAYVLIDSDDDPTTGINTRGALGADHIIVITGKANDITSSRLYEYGVPGAPSSWTYLQDVGSAIDWYRMELGFDPAVIGLAQTDDFALYISVEDWKGDYDAAGSGFHSSSMFNPAVPTKGTRSPEGNNVVLNEFVLEPDSSEWIELVNPTTFPIDISGWEIQAQYRGWRTIYTFPAGSTIGAFGSGSEYVLASDPLDGPWWLLGNQLRSGREVRLMDSGNNLVDSTTLGNAAVGQSYARYKNETYGMPLDTDEDANDWYVTNSGWIVPEGMTRGGPNDRKRPVIEVSKTGNTSVANQGTQVQYTINYDNIGDGRARHVWVNDTIPDGMTYVTSSVAPLSYSGSTYSWYFFNVATGPHTFTITAMVNSTTPTGTLLSNVVNLDYTDQLSNPLPSSSDTWDVNVSGPVPDITVVKTANVVAASPGDQVTYTIYFNNTGSGNAGNVWINDTLPADIIFNNSSPAPTSTMGQTQYWHFTNVAPGSNSITLAADVSLSATPGSTQTNTVTCDLTDPSGSSLPGSSDSFVITVLSPYAQVVINELAVNSNDDEWIEVVNPTGSPVDISGWRVWVRLFGPVYISVYSCPSGSVLGAWGSGSEYLVGYTGLGNDFPNGGRDVHLQRYTGSAWEDVDVTEYPGGISNTQTWSRFKHEDTGKPIDTDNDAHDFYLSASGWIVPEGPTPGAPNDRKRPVMNVEKTASTSQANVGDYITYTIWYNNTGDGNAKRVWVNDTLPTGISFVSSTPTPTAVSGQDIIWYFNNVVHESTNSITLNAQVTDTSITDGSDLVNVATLIYHDALDRVMGTSTSWANVTCVRPQITVAKIVDNAVANATDTLTYTIYYNNTGSGNAGNVWVNDTMPQNTTYQSSSAAPSSVNGDTYTWHFTNVAPGTHSFTITVQVDADAPSGTITNWAFLDYTTAADYVLESSSDSAFTVIPEMRHVIAAILGIMIIGFIGLRTRRWKDE